MDQITEETPLIPVSLPFLQDSLLRFNSLSLDQKDQLSSTDILRPAQLTRHGTLVTAFSLLVLLIARDRKLGEKSSGSSPWDIWKHETNTEEWVKVIDENIEQRWSSFLSAFCGSREIETVLWTEFRMHETSKPLRVVDFAIFHPKLLNDRVLELSLQHRWKRGPFLDLSQSRQYLTPRYDVLCTPWIYHAFDLASQLTFLLLLVSYVLNPPHYSFYIPPLETVGPREIILMVLSVSAILHSWTTSVPFALTLIVFLFNLPLVPFPQDFSFNLLLLGLVLLIIQLHLLFFPSPFLLFWPERCLPLAMLIINGLFGTIFKVLLFFLPVLLLSVYFLSYAMSDVFLRLLLSLSPAPMPTREVFFILAASSFLLLFFSILILMPSLTSWAARTTWDSYSLSIGQLARVQFYRAVLRYSKPYPFPPPFNILYSILIALPAFALPYFGFSSTLLTVLQIILWRVTVGPFVAIARFLTLGWIF